MASFPGPARLLSWQRQQALVGEVDKAQCVAPLLGHLLQPMMNAASACRMSSTIACVRKDEGGALKPLGRQRGGDVCVRGERGVEVVRGGEVDADEGDTWVVDLR